MALNTRKSMFLSFLIERIIRKCFGALHLEINRYSVATNITVRCTLEYSGFQGHSPDDICGNGLHSRCKGAAHRNMVSEMSFKEITHEIICKQKTYSSLIQ